MRWRRAKDPESSAPAPKGPRGIRWLLLALALLTAALIPAVKSTTKAALLLEDMLSPVRLLRALPEPRVSTVDLPDGSALLYEGRSRMPGVVLVHGAAPGGPTDARVVQLCRAFNRLGRTVLAPSLGLGEMRLDLTDTARIRQAIEHLYEMTGDKVALVTFSFGSGYSLVALQEDPAIQDKIVELTTVGTYFDLVHLLQGVTAGEVDAPGGITDEWSPDPRAGRMVTEFLAGHLGLEAEEALLEAYDRREPDMLDLPARAIYELMVNTDPQRTRELVDALPGGVAEQIARLSPATRMDLIRIPVQAMHSRQDPAAPPSESRLLMDALEPPATGRLTLVGSFRHVTPGVGRELLTDAGPLVGFVSRVIGSQERWGIYL